MDKTVVGETEDEIHQSACKDTGDGIDGVVSLNVKGGKEHQYAEDCNDPKEQSVATFPCQPCYYGSHTHVAAGEGRGRPLACIVGELQDMIEEAIGITRYGQ